MWDYGEGNRGGELAVVSIAMAAVSVLAVALRSYTMSTILKRFVIEDWLAVLTCVLQIGFCVIVVVGVSYGLGAHVDNVPEVNRPKALIFKWAGQVAYIVVSTLVKFVVGIFLLRLCVNNNWQRITIIVLLIIVGLFNTFYVFIAIFQCQPIEFYWYRYAGEDAPVTGKCNGHTLATVPTYFAVLIGIVADLVLALLPATLIKGANLDKKTKISVCCVLALGSLASVATIARIPYAQQLLSNPDYLFNFTDLAIWSIVECGIAITASSLATLRPLFIKMKLLATSHLTHRYGNSRYGSAGLPIQSANTITVISSRARSAKRHTAMTGSTGITASTALTGGTAGLASVQEGREGIQVEKEFEMSVITKETSQDSIDRLEAEVNEVISPGSARRKASHDQQHRLPSRSSSFSARSRPAPLQTSFHALPGTSSPSTPVNVSAGSSSSGHRFTGRTSYSPNPSSPSSSQAPQRFPPDGRLRSASYDRSPRMAAAQSPHTIGSAHTHPDSSIILRSPPPMPGRHQHTYSDSTLRSPPPAGAFSPPNFHLPLRGPSHQSIASNHSDLSLSEFRGTATTGGATGLSAPPRTLHAGQDVDYAPIYATSGGGSGTSSPLGSPASFGSRMNRSFGAGSPVVQQQQQQQQQQLQQPSPYGSPAPTSARFHFQRQDTIQERTDQPTKNNNNKGGKRGKQRVSAFLSDADRSSSSSTEGLEGHTEEGEYEEEAVRTPRTPRTPQWPPPRHELPSPLRSHPPASPHGGWV